MTLHFRAQRWREVRLPGDRRGFRFPPAVAGGKRSGPRCIRSIICNGFAIGRRNYYWRSLYQQDPIAEGNDRMARSFTSASRSGSTNGRATGRARVMFARSQQGDRCEGWRFFGARKIANCPITETLYVDADIEKLPDGGYRREGGRDVRQLFARVRSLSRRINFRNCWRWRLAARGRAGELRCRCFI